MAQLRENLLKAQREAQQMKKINKKLLDQLNFNERSGSIASTNPILTTKLDSTIDAGIP